MKRLPPTVIRSFHRAPARSTGKTGLYILTLCAFTASILLLMVSALLAGELGWTPGPVTLPKHEDELTPEDRAKLCGLDTVVCPDEKVTKPAAQQNPKRPLAGSSAEPKTAPQARATSGKTIRATITTYQAVAAQTDASPCTTASGVNACKPPYPIVANNALPFGTKVKIQGEVYVVADRMASRFGTGHFDILTDGENFKLTGELVEIM